MLKTILDYIVFSDFLSKPPMSIIDGGSLSENKRWISLYEFLFQETELLLVNFPEIDQLSEKQKTIILPIIGLTTIRKGTPTARLLNYHKPHKCKFPKSQDIQTVFLIDEKSESEKVKYRKNNGFIFGFVEDYNEQWKRLSLAGKETVLPVRDFVIGKDFRSWQQLDNYILPFTDMIIVDNYMFDESVWKHNLFKIIKKFSEFTYVKFNLLLVSFFHSKQINVNDNWEEKINDILIELGISCNLSIVLTKESIKEHDRGIFTNYLRIRSGDSFVYFDKNGGFLTKGTDIDFHSLAESDKFNAAEAALINIKNIIQKLNTLPDKSKRLFGDLKNRLLEV